MDSAIAEKVEVVTAPPLAKRLEVKIPGVALLFIWTRSNEVTAPNGAAIDVLGRLRKGMRVVASVAAKTRKEKDWSERMFTLPFKMADEVLMVWSMIEAGAKGGADIDAAFEARESLRSLYDRVSEELAQAKTVSGNGA